jgi:hypothetical protein
MNEKSSNRINLDQEAQVVLEELMDDYAGRLVGQATRRQAPSANVVDVSASDLRAAAAGRLGLLSILQLIVVAGLFAFSAGAAVLAFALLPETLHGTIARVAVGLGLFGGVIASLAALTLYAVRQLGTDVVWRWLQQSKMDTPQEVQTGERSTPAR